jgi:ketosteroid isomerase-like protein
METMRVEHSGEMAMELGRFSLAVRRADATITQVRGKYVRVWRRLGAWLLVADSWSWTSQAASDLAA